MVPRRSAAYHLDGTMLRRLRIENLVLIHEAELAFAPGLNAITGETGAGKTILAQAIGLLLGAKGDAAYIGPDGAEAYVEAELDLPPGLLEEEEFESFAELRPEDEEGLLVARRVFADGRTRAYGGGAARPARTSPQPGSGSSRCRGSSSNAGSAGLRTSSTCSTRSSATNS